METQTEMVPVDELRPYRGNPRRGDIALIADSLRKHGQYRPIVVNRGTEATVQNEVLAGNHTLAAAKQLGWSEVLATFVDVDDVQAAQIVLIDNRAADKAEYDDDALTALLSSLPDLDGTGFTADDLADLLDSGDEPHDSGTEEDYRTRFEVVVECASEAAQQALFERLTAEGHTCRLLSL